MQDLHGIDMNSRSVGEDGGVVDFASWVVGLLAARKSTAEQAVRPELLDELVFAICASGTGRLQVFLRDLVRQKVTAPMLADLYVPAAAQALGQGWLDDTVTFAEVTVGSSRLQVLLRSISEGWAADQADGGRSGSVLLTCPPYEQHTLGALVLLGRLRRMGISVALSLGASQSELQRRFREGNYDAVLVSTATTGRTRDLAGFVRQIKAFAPKGVPVVIGGAVPFEAETILAATQADAVISDLEQALRFCGLLDEEQIAQKRA